jgi:phage-related protein
VLVALHVFIKKTQKTPAGIIIQTTRGGSSWRTSSASEPAVEPFCGSGS